MDTKMNGINSNQIAAIHFSKKEAEKLAHDHPEILDLAKNGTTQSQLVGIYLPEVKNAKTAKSIIMRTMKTLATAEERWCLYQEHQRTSAQKNGKVCVQEKKGIFAMSRDELIVVARKGNSAAILAKGQVPFDGERRFTEFGEMMTEAEYVAKLADVKRADRRLTWETIRRLTNAVFGNNRTKECVRVRCTFYS